MRGWTAAMSDYGLSYYRNPTQRPYEGLAAYLPNLNNAIAATDTGFNNT